MIDFWEAREAVMTAQAAFVATPEDRVDLWTTIFESWGFAAEDARRYAEEHVNPERH